MNDLTGFQAFNRVSECREKRMIIFHPVPRDVNNDDSERQLLEIVLVLEALVDGDQDVALALGLCDQLGVREGAPLGFGYSQNFMIGERFAETRIDALV
jgi:hypothetical protein